MRKIQNNIIIFLISLLPLVTSCSQTSEPLGEYHGLDGEHFDAKLNGSAWYPDEVLLGHPMSLTYSGFIDTYKYHYFELQVNRNENPWSRITIHIDSLHGLGTYNLTDTASSSWSLLLMGTSPVSTYYYSDKKHSGILEITNIDTTSRLIDGTVSFDAAAGTSVIHLTEGVFKARY